MSGLPFAALVLCLLITAGESQQFIINVEESQISATVGDDASFSVRTSGKVSQGRWLFNGRTVARWIGQNVYIDDAYLSRAEILISSGSLLLKSVNLLDSGEYHVEMVPVRGPQTSETVTLRVTGPYPESAESTASYTAIFAVVLGVPGVTLIGAVIVWLILIITGRLKEPLRSTYIVNIDSGRTSTLDANTVSTSQPDENLPRNEQGAGNDGQGGSSTYMGLIPEDRTVYSDVRR
ncbi:uncharacterized protein [Hemitrygon akajei]|uniref:uncharacterized protein n=1 Tax=Hemitrygon akajei TaxID=2704970 RepID=UPI003BF9D25C